MDNYGLPPDVKCLTCADFTFKEVGDAHIANGFGNCLHDAKYVMYHATKDRQCAEHNPLDKAEAEKRADWLAEKIGVAQVMGGRT